MYMQWAFWGGGGVVGEGGGKWGKRGVWGGGVGGCLWTKEGYASLLGEEKVSMNISTRVMLSPWSDCV